MPALCEKRNRALWGTLGLRAERGKQREKSATRGPADASRVRHAMRSTVDISSPLRGSSQAARSYRARARCGTRTDCHAQTKR